MKKALRQGADKAAEGYRYATENSAVSAAILTGAVLVVGATILFALLNSRQSTLRPAYPLPNQPLP